MLLTLNTDRCIPFRFKFIRCCAAPNRFFRVVPARECTNFFASDRSHMLRRGGVYSSQPPELAPLRCVLELYYLYSTLAARKVVRRRRQNSDRRSRQTRVWSAWKEIIGRYHSISFLPFVVSQDGMAQNGSSTHTDWLTHTFSSIEGKLRYTTAVHTNFPPAQSVVLLLLALFFHFTSYY